jgi:hypothetical protein
MHTHIIINHDEGLHLVISSQDEDLDILRILDEIILEQLACHA